MARQVGIRLGFPVRIPSRRVASFSAADTFDLLLQLLRLVFHEQRLQAALEVVAGEALGPGEVADHVSHLARRWSGWMATVSYGLSVSFSYSENQKV